MCNLLYECNYVMTYIDLFSKFDQGRSPCKFAIVVGGGTWPAL